MQHVITPKNVMAVVIEVDTMLKTKSFNTAEIMLGLQELVGRLIVDMAATPAAADELVRHCKKHLDDTIHIGMGVKRDSP